MSTYKKGDTDFNSINECKVICAMRERAKRFFNIFLKASSCETAIVEAICRLDKEVEEYEDTMRVLKAKKKQHQLTKEWALKSYQLTEMRANTEVLSFFEYVELDEEHVSNVSKYNSCMECDVKVCEDLFGESRYCPHWGIMDTIRKEIKKINEFILEELCARTPFSSESYAGFEDIEAEKNDVVNEDPEDGIDYRISDDDGITFRADVIHEEWPLMCTRCANKNREEPCTGISEIVCPYHDIYTKVCSKVVELNDELNTILGV